MGTAHGGVGVTPPIRTHLWRRLRLRSLLTTAALAALALAPAGAASAQVAYGAIIDLVPPTPAAGTPLAGVQHLKAQAVAVVIRSLHLIIRSDDPSIPAFQIEADKGMALGQQVVDLEWDTTKLTHNGAYRLEASAEVCGPPAGCRVIAATRTGLLVANPPATPAGVHAQFRNNTPMVSWAAGGEGDLLGYEVLRSSSGSAVPVGSVRAGATAFADTTAPAGVGVSYSVAAVRRSPVTAPGGGCGSFGARCTVSSPSTPTPLIVMPVQGPPSLPDSGPPNPAPDQGQPGPAPAPAPPAVRSNPAPAPPAPQARTPQQKAPQPAAPAPAAPLPLPAVTGDQVPAIQVPAIQAPPAPVGPDVQGLQVAPPSPQDTTIATHDRVDTSKPDKTAAVLTFALLALGFYGAYRARQMLRSKQQS